MLRVLIILLFLLTSNAAYGQTAEATVTINPDVTKQTFDGMGCGSIFYSGHLNSLGKRKKTKLQNQLYDDIFKEVPTKFLHIMIRPDFERTNDNDDPYKLEFDEDNFNKNRDALKVCREAKKRRPEMKIYATLYSPPAWMKTNNDESGGGKKKATLKKGFELELAEYIWAYLVHMNESGCPVDYLSICNEPDWGHFQPSYFLKPDEHADLFRILVDYFETMAQRYPDLPKAKLVAPNGIGVINAAKRYLPSLDKKSAAAIDVIGSHDYDRSREDRWELLREIAGDRPVWCTEWCWNGPDRSNDLIISANASWSVMCDGFNHGLNVWMAYDWVYPPREGGEALIHVDWGKSYHRTKMYYAFRQWSRPLTPGMKIVQSKVDAPTTRLVVATGGKKKRMESIVKSSAFVDVETGRLVVHLVNITDDPAEFNLQVKSPRYRDSTFSTTRTSAKVSEQAGAPVTLEAGKYSATLGPREMLTLETGQR